MGWSTSVDKVRRTELIGLEATAPGIYGRYTWFCFEKEMELWCALSLLGPTMCSLDSVYKPFCDGEVETLPNICSYTPYLETASLRFSGFSVRLFSFRVFLP